MKKIIEIDLSPSESPWDTDIKTLVSAIILVPPEEITAIKLLKRSVDARQRDIRIHHTLEVFVNETPEENPLYKFHYKNVSECPRVIIVGAGPAGLFAALRLLELGLKPVIIERGKKVEERKSDIADINKKRIIDPDSNYCFGEGGAGTYSDGKLYTRSTKRGDVKRILHQFTEHGAVDDILVDAHPHIGTDKLPAIISKMRNTILNNGGEIHFGQRVTDIIIRDNQAKGVVTSNENKFEGEAVILATGHSSRDIYDVLLMNKILIEPKPFAVGVRIEHPQQLIDSIQYHSTERNQYLPAAAYSLACQAGNKGVFSFCMCPGGTIVTASTQPQELVLNGMSNSQRNQPFANSGLVVTVDEIDFMKDADPLSGIRFQEQIERNAFIAGGSNLGAPAQRMMDFAENKISASLNSTSYFPGIVSTPLHELLPRFITTRLQEAFTVFGNKMKGYLTNEATLLGMETRTSSPIRITRDSETLEHKGVANFYPCGEGSGYAGGIVSSAIDGQRCAESVAKKILG